MRKESCLTRVYARYLDSAIDMFASVVNRILTENSLAESNKVEAPPLREGGLRRCFYFAVNPSEDALNNRFYYLLYYAQKVSSDSHVISETMKTPGLADVNTHARDRSREFKS